MQTIQPFPRLLALVLLTTAISAWSAVDEARPTAEQLLKKVAAKYQSMKSYSAKGETVSEIDSSNVPPTALTGVDPKLAESKEFQEARRKPRKSRHTFSILLGRPSLYRIEWEQQVHPTFTNGGAAWSLGEGDFVRLSNQQPFKPQNRMMALAMATGVSGGAANTIPSAFFESESNLLAKLQQPTFEKDELIENDECHVISGTLANQKMVLWISKKTLLVRQRRHILGGAMVLPEFTDEQVKQALKAQNKEATPEAIAQLKALMTKAVAMSANLKGSMTETHREIVVDQPVKPEQFQPKPVPPSTAPTRSVTPSPAAAAPGNAWFYDVVSKDYFTDKTTRVAPFIRDNGHTAVRAHFFTCGDCTEQERFLGYYEKYTDEVKAKLEQKSKNFALYEMAFQGRLYSTDGEHWFPAEKPEGTQITADLQKKCPPKKLRYCPPQ